jgi:hypothetical protein
MDVLRRLPRGPPLGIIVIVGAKRRHEEMLPSGRTPRSKDHSPGDRPAAPYRCRLSGMEAPSSCASEGLDGQGWRMWL